MSKKSQAVDHPHKYRRYFNTFRGTARWKCGLCSHYLTDAEQLLGRFAECGDKDCRNTFTIFPRHLLRAGYTGLRLAQDANLDQRPSWRGWRTSVVCGVCEQRQTPEERRATLKPLELKNSFGQKVDIFGRVLADSDDFGRPPQAKPTRSDSEQDNEDPANAGTVTDGKMFYDKED